MGKYFICLLFYLSKLTNIQLHIEQNSENYFKLCAWHKVSSKENNIVSDITQVNIMLFLFFNLIKSHVPQWKQALSLIKALQLAVFTNQLYETKF